MASTYTTSLKIQQMGNGEDSGTWGTITNTNWNLIEAAVAGVTQITMANANYTLSNLNGTADEARSMVLAVGGTNSAIYQVVAPLVTKFYVVTNNTSGGYAITIGASTGAIISVPNGTTVQVYCDGTNFYSAQTGSAGNFLVNGTLTAAGETETGNMTVGGTLGVTGVTSLNGGGTSTTPVSTDNSTKIATTAFVQSNLSGLGTMSTQNANDVSISGGAINGVSGTNSGMTVGNATNATYATTAGNGGVTSVNGNTGAVTISTTPTGLGWGGTTWHYPGRSFNTTYYNPYSYPIAVSASTTCSSGSQIYGYVNGNLVSFFQWQYNGCGSYGGAFIIVPPGASYSLNSGQGVYNWAELY
jgi:hypothetical protein